MPRMVISMRGKFTAENRRPAIVTEQMDICRVCEARHLRVPDVVLHAPCKTAPTSTASRALRSCRRAGPRIILVRGRTSPPSPLASCLEVLLPISTKTRMKSVSTMRLGQNPGGAGRTRPVASGHPNAASPPLPTSCLAIHPFRECSSKWDPSITI